MKNNCRPRVGIYAAAVFLLILIAAGIFWFTKAVPQTQKIETCVLFSEISECAGMEAFEKSDYHDPKAPSADTVTGQYVKTIRWENHRYNVICYAFQNDAQALDYWESQGQSDKVLQENAGYYLSSGLFGTKLFMMHHNRVCMIDADATGESFVAFYQWLTGRFTDAYLKLPRK